MKTIKNSRSEFLVLCAVALVVWIGSAIAANAALKPKPPVPPAPPTASR